MLRTIPSFGLLAFPGLLIGLIQLGFSGLSVLLFHDDIARLFFFPAILIITISLFFISRNSQNRLDQISYRESMLYVSCTWILCGVLGAIPIQLIVHLSFTDSVFESISALTTTGATIISHLDDQPKTLLMYRQFLQWVGGLGVIIFVVAILPMLNIGGMKILKAETPGPIKDEKLFPRVAHSARYFWYIYVTITILCCFGYVAAGMNWFDAVAHSLSTVSTGGFSTHDDSIGFFQSRWIEINADVFMLLGAISFSLHFRFFRTLNIETYSKDEETKTFLLLVLGLSLVLFTILWSHAQFENILDDFLHSLFLLISFTTSTGFGAADFTNWPQSTGLILVFASYLGGCAGSTAGGNKIIRNIISFKLMKRQLKQLLHPQGIFAIRYNGIKITQDILSSTTAFITFSAFLSVLLTLLLNAAGLDFWSAFTAVSACINVLGPAFGELASNFQPISDIGTWILSFTMLLGRLEFFTVLVIFSKYFWR